jgi:cysteine synthase
MPESQVRLYVGLGFLAGVLLTLGFKDVYPDLERRWRQRKRRYSALSSHPALNAAVHLQDNTKNDGSGPEIDIPEGIEGCIGNTTLFKIKSLSEATGCEILAKAEVCHGLCGLTGNV